MFRLLIITIYIVLTGCGETLPRGKDARILLIGDSMLSANNANGAGVANVIEAEVNTNVVDRSVSGARYFHIVPASKGTGFNIRAQYEYAPWDVIIINGGGNDLLFGCGCGACDGVLNDLISADGRRGVIPTFVSRLRQSGAIVYYIGYLRNPGIPTPIRSCRRAGDELDRRLANLDKNDPGMHFLPMSDLVPYGDSSYFALDYIHPSPKGSREIGRRIAREIAPVLAHSPGQYRIFPD